MLETQPLAAMQMRVRRCGVISAGASSVVRAVWQWMAAAVPTACSADAGDRHQQ
ncbi:hypothetical protein XCR_4569 [Xanthomonas campestris pv. raphani 756C]|nr:hypothetical protein XCR_4569 [Xanthomonas campestris pv. raphani 756C]